MSAGCHELMRTKDAHLVTDAADVLDIIHELDLRDVTFVGHSVSSMIGALAVPVRRLVKQPL